MSISIFACDHRQNQEWNLPYIRFGGPESSCIIKCENHIFGKKVNPDEVPKLFWLWQNISQFGCDIIGYCQYRRFFTNMCISMPLINIPQTAYRREFALDPGIQEKLIYEKTVDGILHPHFKVIDDRRTQYKYIWEQIGILSGDDMLQQKWRRYAFELLLSYADCDIKSAMEKSFEIKENYLCNIFTAKTKVFSEFGNCAFSAIRDLLDAMPESDKSVLHPYWLAYLFERYTSCWYHAVEISGKYKFAKIPLMTIDAQKHIEWKRTEK